MVEVRGIRKRFGVVQALDGVSLQFAPGEVHGIVGENGAGKSTLMNVLAGIHQPDEGEIRVGAESRRFAGPRDSMLAGIAMIHQELNLVDHLSVAENIYLGREPRTAFWLDRKTMNARAAELLQQVGAEVSPGTPLRELSIARQQLVEIAKAVSMDARFVIMDEPTAVLSEPEIVALFGLIRELKNKGVTVLYISHILSEVLEVCDRITVMRDGQVVRTLPAHEATAESLASLMVGRELADVYPEKLPVPEAPPVLDVENVDGLTLAIRPGEIVGLAGLVGSGRTEAAEAIAGFRPRSGSVRVGGLAVPPGKPKKAVEAGIAYVSEDRKSAGLHLTLSGAENTTMANLSAYARPVVDRAKETETTERWIQKLRIKIGSPQHPVSSMSGGNQQKVSLAKWLDTQPKVLLLDEPTRGVDVGAKREIYLLINELARDGLACLVVSSEIPELLGLCHRILVLRQGRIVGEVTQETMSEQAIMRYAAGVEEAVQA